MIVFRKHINVLIFCFCMSSVLQGMQPQVQSTSSAVSSNAQVQTSHDAESTAISVPTIQRQSAAISSLSSQPFFKGVDQQLLQAFMQAIADEDDDALEDFFDHYSVVYPLIKALVYYGCFDYLDRMFDYIETYDLPFDINAVPDDESDLLLVVACFQLSTYKGTVSEETYKKIVELLLEEGADITYFVQRDLIQWVKFLIEMSGDLQSFNDYGGSRLYGVCCSEEMKKTLDDAHITQFQSGSCYQALVTAVEKNDTAVAKAAIHQGAKAHALFAKDGSHILSVAARNNNKELTELLLTFADCTLDYLVAINDYESVQFIFTELQDYSISLAECKRLLGIVARSTKNLSHVKALLDEQRQFLELRGTDDDEKEIADMTNNFVGKISFTKSETNFIFAVSQYQYKKAQRILAQDSTIRLTLIEIAEKNLMTFILSDPLTSQRAEDQKTFVAFLLKNHFNQLYPMIQDMVRNNQYALLKDLIACGLDVNARAQFPGSEELLYEKPETTCSLLGVAFQEAARRNDNDITMIIFLLKAQASLPEFLKERGFYCTQHDFQILEKVIAAIGTKIPHDWFEKRKLCTETDLWTLGVLLFESITNSDPRSLSVLMKELPSILVTQPKQNSVEYVAHIVAEHNSVSSKKSKKRHLHDEEIIESQNTGKRVKVEHKQEERREQTTAPRLSLTPSLSETATVHQAQPVSLIRPFDPSRWLNTVSLDVTRS